MTQYVVEKVGATGTVFYAEGKAYPTSDPQDAEPFSVRMPIAKYQELGAALGVVRRIAADFARNRLAFAGVSPEEPTPSEPPTPEGPPAINPPTPEGPPAIDPPTQAIREITIHGTGELAEYLLTVTGEILSAVSDLSRGITIDSGDVIAQDRKTATGTVRGGKDGYVFTGFYTLEWVLGTGTVTEVA